MEALHKWIATILVVFTVAWAGLAYYVNTQVALADLKLTNRVLIVEQTVKSNTEMISELKLLRLDINNLRLELTKVKGR